MMEKRNPMDYCQGCDTYLGFRGFCSIECHNKCYDEKKDKIENKKKVDG